LTANVNESSDFFADVMMGAAESGKPTVFKNYFRTSKAYCFTAHG